MNLAEKAVLPELSQKIVVNRTVKTNAAQIFAKTPVEKGVFVRSVVNCRGMVELV